MSSSKCLAKNKVGLQELLLLFSLLTGTFSNDYFFYILFDTCDADSLVSTSSSSSLSSNIRLYCVTTRECLWRRWRENTVFTIRGAVQHWHSAFPCCFFTTSLEIFNCSAYEIFSMYPLQLLQHGQLKISIAPWGFERLRLRVCFFFFIFFFSNLLCCGSQLRKIVP